jgi:predicted alpha/beta superfamily hydrolase
MITSTSKPPIAYAKVFFCVCFLILQACSGQFGSGAANDPLMTDFAVASKYPSVERMLTVSVPANYNQRSEQRYPVLFHIADDADHIEQIRSVVTELSGKNQIPEMIVVSLHHYGEDGDIYPLEDSSDNNEERRPEQFLSYIEQEVMPLIETKYRVSTDRIATGWSRFGILPTFALGHKPALFSGIIVRSSAGVGGYDSMLSDNIENMLTINPDTSAIFHFSIGDDETQRTEPFNHLKGVIEQSAPTSMHWQAEVIEDAGHSDTFAKGLARGLIFYFSKK